MVEGYVSCVNSLFVPCALAGTGCAINHTQAEPGHVGDRRKALLNKRTCGLVLRPRRSRLGETRGERLMSTQRELII